MEDLSQATVDTNSKWFHDNDHYVESQSNLEHYRHVRRSVEKEIAGVERLLDVGNCGFFNYDTTLVKHVTAVDLFLEDGPGPLSNSTFRKGSLLDLPFPDASFDCIMQQNVFHHVTGRSVKENHANLRRCLQEMYRCLAPGGKAVIVESTVGPIFHVLECILYRPILFLKRGGHPVTFQFTPKHILGNATKCGFQLEEFCYIPRGMFVLQMGYRWPSCLTPVKPIKLILRRPKDAMGLAGEKNDSGQQAA